MAKKLDRLYIRVDALFPGDDKYQALPYKLRDSAYLFFAALNGWSRDKRTDGRIPTAVALAIGRAMQHSEAKTLGFLAALAAPGVKLIVWTEDEVFIPTYPKWQDTKDEIEDRSEMRREAGRRGGLASGRSRREAIASPVLQANAKQNEAETEGETVTPPVAPPEASAGRVGELQEGCQALLKRPLRGDERPVLLGWVGLERDGAEVPVAEILGLVAHLLARPARDGTLPGTLRYCDATVLALARAAWTGLPPESPAVAAGSMVDPELLRGPTDEERTAVARALPGLRAAIGRLGAGMALEGSQ